MEIIILLAIVVMLGGLFGGDSFGDTVRTGCVAVMVLIPLIVGGLLMLVMATE